MLETDDVRIARLLRNYRDGSVGIEREKKKDSSITLNCSFDYRQNMDSRPEDRGSNTMSSR